ncbi:MAG: hypothetical protein ABIJ05_01120 [Patescibacteria group bacterium]
MEKPIIEINKKDIIKEAIDIVNSTKNKLFVTTRLTKEETKIGKKYNKALLNALNRGVKVERVCFGSSKAYKKYVKFVDKRIIFYCVTQEHLYQRMLLSDDSILLFRLGSSFYKSKNLLVIQAIKRYIDDVVS